MVVSQNHDNDATNSLISSVIRFETSGYISYRQLINFDLLNSNSIDKEIEFSRRNLICSTLVVYKEFNGPDSNITQDAFNQCMGLSLTSLLEQENKIINQSYSLQNLSDSIDPISETANNFKEFSNQRNRARIWQDVGYSTFGLGFLIFYYCSLEYIFMRKHLTQRAKGEMIK